jgi:hypothetical protein
MTSCGSFQFGPGAGSPFRISTAEKDQHFRIKREPSGDDHALQEPDLLLEGRRAQVNRACSRSVADVA